MDIISSIRNPTTDTIHRKHIKNNVATLKHTYLTVKKKKMGEQTLKRLHVQTIIAKLLPLSHLSVILQWESNAMNPAQ